MRLAVTCHSNLTMTVHWKPLLLGASTYHKKKKNLREWCVWLSSFDQRLKMLPVLKHESVTRPVTHTLLYFMNSVTFLTGCYFKSCWMRNCLFVLSAFLHQLTWYLVRLCSKFNEQVQADPKQCPDTHLPSSFSLSLWAHRKCAIHYTALFRPLWAEPLVFYLKEIVLSWHFYTCCNYRSWHYYTQNMNALFL